MYGVYNGATTSPTAADNGNIDISGKLTANLNNGKYNIGISSEGGVITLDGATVKIPGNYYYGIYNENGNVIIKNGSDVDISSDISSNRGITTESSGSLTIDKSIVKVSANGIVAEIYENASIKDSTVDLTITNNHYEVIRTAPRRIRSTFPAAARCAHRDGQAGLCHVRRNGNSRSQHEMRNEYCYFKLE